MKLEVWRLGRKIPYILKVKIIRMVLPGSFMVLVSTFCFFPDLFTIPKEQYQKQEDTIPVEDFPNPSDHFLLKILVED